MGVESPMKAVVDCEDIYQHFTHCGHSSPSAGVSWYIAS